MHDISNATYYEDAARRAFREEVANVHPQYVLPQIRRRAHRREAWFLAFVVTAALGALLIVVGLLLTWGQEQPAPAPSSPTSTRLWEA